MNLPKTATPLAAAGAAARDALAPTAAELQRSALKLYERMIHVTAPEKTP